MVLGREAPLAGAWSVIVHLGTGLIIWLQSILANGLKVCVMDVEACNVAVISFHLDWQGVQGSNRGLSLRQRVSTEKTDSRRSQVVQGTYRSRRFQFPVPADHVLSEIPRYL